MNNRSRQSTRYYTRRRRRPALLGTAAVASVVMLAFGGLLLVGLDTVGSQGRQLARVIQPEAAQAPEIADKAGSGGETARDSGEVEKDSEAQNRDESSGGEQAKKEPTKEEPAKEEQAAGQKSDKGQGGEQAKQQKQEEPDPPAPNDPTMSMTIPRLAMWGDTVWNTSSAATMDVGAIKLPPTGFPWQENANTYISAHRIGYPGTQSYNQFYSLPAMQQGDAVYLTDANGTTYEYRVTNKFAVKPWENWVTEPQAGGDMVTLQTCVDSLDPSTWWDITPALMESGPDTARLIVQAEKVDTIPAG